MTKCACAWSGRKLSTTDGPGRPRVYCKPSCKQRDYEARRRATELGLGEDNLFIARAELEAICDRLYLLQCAVDDVERVLANGDVGQRAAVASLLEAKRDCLGSR